MSQRQSLPLPTIEFVDTPDAAERWRRAYALILAAASRKRGEQGIDKSAGRPHTARNN